MNSPIFTLNVKDLAKGAVVAVVSAVIVYIAEQLGLPGFDFTTFDWSTVVSVALTAFAGYLTKNFLSDNQGKVFGKIG